MSLFKVWMILAADDSSRDFSFALMHISLAALIFRALSDYQLYSLYKQLQTYHLACKTRYTLYIPSPCRPHTSTKVYPFPTLVNISLHAYLYHTPCSILWYFQTSFLAPGHHLASVVVVCRKLFQKSSPLKLPDQLKPNLIWIIGCLVSKLCLMMPCTNQHGHCY